MTWRKDNRVALENDGSRVDIVEKVTGRARFGTDYYPPNLLWAAFIRCPFGKATLVAADLDAARKVPGIVDVEIDNKEGTYHGDRLGYICADSRQALEEGLAALKLKFNVGQPATRPEDVRTPLEKIESKNPQKAEAALAEADAVQEATYATQVQTHCCLEPHMALVDFKGDHAIAWGSTQGCIGFRDNLAKTLGLPQDKVEFHCEYIGGGFGSKFGAGAEGELAARLSKKFNRPCRVALDRKEEQLDSGNRPGSIQYMKIGVGKDGKLRGGRVHVWGVVGPSGGGGGAQNPSIYDWGAINKTHEDVHINGGHPRAMRAPGWPQGVFGVEMMMDELAAKLGMDPLQFRLLNDGREERREMMKVGAELIGWNRRRPDGQWPGIVKHGFGMGGTQWGNSPGKATIQVNIYRDGTVEALSASQDIGTGYRTVLTDCVASQLGVPRARVSAKCGVSTYPPGPASGGSVTTRFTAPKMLNAAEQAKQGIIAIVAKEWNIEPARITLKGGEFSDGQRTMPWERACKLITKDPLTFSASEDDGFWKNPTGSSGVQFVEVAVDTETGITRVLKVIALQDVGQAVNRNTVENQITGGVIQGLSFALFENRILNREIGAMVNPNMDMYKIAGPRDVPEIIPVIWVSREDASPNGLGEPPVIPTAGAIGCAIANAIGARVRSIPITPARVLAALQTARGGQS